MNLNIGRKLRTLDRWIVSGLQITPPPARATARRAGTARPVAPAVRRVPDTADGLISLWAIAAAPKEGPR